MGVKATNKPSEGAIPRRGNAYFLRELFKVHCVGKRGQPWRDGAAGQEREERPKCITRIEDLLGVQVTIGRNRGNPDRTEIILQGRGIMLQIGIKWLRKEIVV